PLDRPAHDFDDAPARMKGALAEQAARIGPAVERMARRVKTTIGLLAKGKRADDDAMPRRTTAPAPGGGLRSTGRRGVRAEAPARGDDAAARASAQRAGRRRAAIAASVMATAVLGAMWIKRSHHDATVTAEPPGATAEAAKSGPAATTVSPQPGAVAEAP